MGQFQSNFQTAEQIATQMGTASDTIQNAANKSITQASRTTLTINSQAQEVNQQAVQAANQFHTGFQQVINNIQSVAKEFERMDNELHKNFNNPLFTNTLTYANAKK